MRLRDTRLFCRFQKDPTAVPVIIRERSIKEDTFEALALVGISSPHPVAMIGLKEITRVKLQLNGTFCQNLVPFHFPLVYFAYNINNFFELVVHVGS